MLLLTLKLGRELSFIVRYIEAVRIVGTTRFLGLKAFTWPSPWPPGIDIGALPTDTDPPAVTEIGSTWYAPSAQRTGVNTEYKFLMHTHAFNVWHTMRVTLKTDARNVRSRSAIQRIGATFERIRGANVPANNGNVRDTAYYSILRKEWSLVCKNFQERLQKGVNSSTK
jgi:RimJ/RimL family protein N-acetyltransferase